MKFFTPNLLARCRSEDDTIADSASQEWERANGEYEKYLEEIQPALSRSIRFLLSRLRLHDAKVLTMALDEEPHFSIFVQPHGQTEGTEELRYRLASPPRSGQHGCLAADAEPFRFWLYDEIGIKEGAFAFTHSILFTGGQELQLTFYSLSCRHLSWAFPPGYVIDSKAPITLFTEGIEPPLSARWKQPKFLPLGA